MEQKAAAGNRGSEERQENTVAVSTEIEASPDTVWGILATPERFSAWMDGEITFDARAGSPFRAGFPNYGVVLGGEVVEIDPVIRRLALTWGSESGPQAASMPAGSTLVEFSVVPSGDGSRIAVTHSRFQNATLAAEHNAGWRFHLSRLALFANRADLSAGLARTLPAWYAAWNQADETERLASLRACCDEGIEFRDDWATARGIERLSLHIANCHRFMPGWRIEASGELCICRGEALAGWRSTGPRGETTGWNVIRATHDGTIRRVTGFSG